MPNIAAFKSTFTPSCNQHDKCLTTLGTQRDGCSSAFLSNMQSACAGAFGWLLPVEYAVCMDTANQYYAAVYLSDQAIMSGMTSSQWDTLQKNAFDRSVVMQSNVLANTCGTSAERTTLYDSSLISRVNAAFMSYAGRLPTVYEFFQAVNDQSILFAFKKYNATTAWQTYLETYAAQRAALPPPSSAYTIEQFVWWDPNNDHVAMTVTTPASSYLWKVSGKTGTSRVLEYNLARKTFETSYNAQGFVVVTAPNGAKNMAVVDTVFTVEGRCWTDPNGNTEPC